MSTWEIAFERPESSEYHIFYGTYIDQVPDGNVFEQLRTGVGETKALFTPHEDEIGDVRYAEGKWSVREVLTHVVDTERIFQFRALAFARSDPGEYPGMDQDDYVAASVAEGRSVASLLDELEAVRTSSLHLFGGLHPDVALRTGRASGVEFTVRSLAWIIAGHEIHHRNVLRERYLDA